MKKRIISLLLAVVLISTMIPLSAVPTAAPPSGGTGTAPMKLQSH